MRPVFAQVVFVALLLALPASAQQGSDQQDKDQQSSSSSKPAAGESSSVKPTGQTPAAKPDSGTYDPVTAEEDIEVGTFYMHKGDIDAAISRFQDAIHQRSNYAKPRLLLAEAYEKKHDNASALKYYKEYLQVFPHAPDAKKIQSKIDKLSGE